MMMRKLWLGILMSLLSVAFLSGSIYAQAPAKEKAPVTMTVKGKIVYSQTVRGYVIRTRGEVYGIVNPNPEVLKPLAKSGKTVTIEGGTMVGDSLAIERIDGKEYRGGKGTIAK
jgi:hypothetical protein